ncbi:acyltransferase domain-containing protein [Streptomyces massasporeus]
MTASAKWRPCGANRWSACPTSLEEGGRSGPHELTTCISERSDHGGDFPGHDAPLKEIPVCDMPRQDAERLCAAAGGQLFVASHLAPGQVCLSGTPGAVTEAEQELSARGIATLRTPIDYAGHSSLLARIAPELVCRIGTLRTRRPAVPYWSTVTGGFVDGAGLDAAYWVRTMCEPTLLEEGVRDLAGRRALAQRRDLPASGRPVLRPADADGPGRHPFRGPCRVPPGPAPTPRPGGPRGPGSTSTGAPWAPGDGRPGRCPGPARGNGRQAFPGAGGCSSSTEGTSSGRANLSN